VSSLLAKGCCTHVGGGGGGGGKLCAAAAFGCEAAAATTLGAATAAGPAHTPQLSLQFASMYTLLAIQSPRSFQRGHCSTLLSTHGSGAASGRGAGATPLAIAIAPLDHGSWASGVAAPGGCVSCCSDVIP
jgi:hypothetical protein